MTLTPKDLADRFDAAHLKEIDALALAEEQEALLSESTDTDVVDKVHMFELAYKAKNGVLWKGSFTTKILSIRERQLVGILRAKLNGNIPIDSLDSLTSELNLIIAHLSYSLTDKPDWAKDFLAIEDFTVLQAIYGEVASHEAKFFGWDKE